MKESDYIIIRNATKLKIALEIIKDILPTGDILSEDDFYSIKMSLAQAVDKHNNYLDKMFLSNRSK